VWFQAILGHDKKMILRLKDKRKIPDLLLSAASFPVEGFCSLLVYSSEKGEKTLLFF